MQYAVAYEIERLDFGFHMFATTPEEFDEISIE